MKWIPIEERLPDHSRPVLVWRNTGTPSYSTCAIPYNFTGIEIARYACDEFMMGHHDFNCAGVTHWMELPSAPEGAVVGNDVTGEQL